MIWSLLYFPFLDLEYRLIRLNSDINFWINFLVLLVFIIVLSMEIVYKFSVRLIMISLYYLITVRNWLRFFFIYEIVFVLIIFSIIVLGYRYERLIAAFLIIIYSFYFSRPVIIILLIFDYIFMIKNWLKYSVVVSYFLVASFIVKFPIFGFHYWLPVAHVEASTIGSMILAGVLLKLGSLGLFYIVFYLRFIVKFHWIAAGVPCIILIILFIRDLKIIIAYSSVAHIRLVFYVLIIGSNVGKTGALIIIFYHGFVSPLIFWVVGLLSWWKTRSLLVVKNITFSFIFFYLMFILCIINIGFPPFLGFLREILIFKALVIYNLVLMIMILRVLFRCYYNIYLLWSFSASKGFIFKLNVRIIDVFIIMIFSLRLNLF